MFRAAISNNDLKEIQECTHKGWALGSERFKAQIETLTQRRAVSKGAGRPRKEDEQVRPKENCMKMVRPWNYRSMDHRPIGGREKPYHFVDVPTLIGDFMKDVEKAE